jgi:hypothetical protein
MTKENIEMEVENLKKCLLKLDTVISLNLSGKFIVSHEKVVGARQIVLNTIMRMQGSLHDQDV